MYKLGHINLNIDIKEIKSFKYTREPLNLQEEDKWETGVYNGMTFGGELYSGKNYIPEWTKQISKDLNMKDCGYSFYKMKTNCMWTHSVPHFAANIGIEDRYTLQITGVN